MPYSQKYTPPHCFFCNFAGWAVTEKCDPVIESLMSNVIKLLLNVIKLLLLGVTQNTLLDTIPDLQKLWKVSMRIKPIGVKTGWSNVFAATIGNSYNNYGDRTPALFMKSETTKLQVCGPVNYPFKFYCIPEPIPVLPMNVFSTVEVQQIPNENGKSLFIYKLNGVVKWRTTPTYPTTFHNVKVYGSDPWYPPSSVVLEDYKFHSGMYLS